MDMKHTAQIPQKLHEPTRYLVFTVDEISVAGFVIMLGVLVQKPIIGILFGVLLAKGWIKLKSIHGPEGLIAWVYWWFPNSLSIFKTFPPSHVDEWIG